MLGNIPHSELCHFTVAVIDFWVDKNFDRFFLSKESPHVIVEKTKVKQRWPLP